MRLLSASYNSIETDPLLDNRISTTETKLKFKMTSDVIGYAREPREGAADLEQQNVNEDYSRAFKPARKTFPGAG